MQPIPIPQMQPIHPIHELLHDSINNERKTKTTLVVSYWYNERAQNA